MKSIGLNVMYAGGRVSDVQLPASGGKYTNKLTTEVTHGHNPNSIIIRVELVSVATRQWAFELFFIPR